jgi:hypothetical protein
MMGWGEKRFACRVSPRKPLADMQLRLFLVAFPGRDVSKVEGDKKNFFCTPRQASEGFWRNVTGVCLGISPEQIRA